VAQDRRPHGGGDGAHRGQPRSGSSDPRSRSPRRGAPSSGRRGDTPPRGKGGDPERRSGPPGLDVPTGSATPLGLERARSRPGAPPRGAVGKAAPPRPDLPVDEEPQLPRGIKKEIDRVIGANARGRDVALALSVGSAAIDEGEVEVAVEMLAWAKDQAPRIAAVREAYGVALYLAEDYATALSELQAYRRLTGRNDQNHLVADCLRALGREVDRVVDAAQELVADTSAPEDRRTEAAIVWAAALADAGDVGAGRAVLRRVLREAGDADHHLRARYLAGELAARDGDDAAAREAFQLILAVDPDFLDTADQLAALSS
jgi:tetratricopeptide (TPR) repeat protein